MPNVRDDADPLLGLAAGLAGGLVAALVMTEFQSLLSKGGITSGVKGAPSTEKAADRLSRAITGHGVPRRRKPAAGEAVHYAVGAAVGGLYGLAAEIEPRVTLGRGAAFGVASATVVDEGLVPATGLGDPFWKAPLRSHPYSYASHLVFGATTEAARALIRRFLDKVKAGVAAVRRKAEPRPPLETQGPQGWRALGLAFLLGASGGNRTSAPLLAVTWAAKLGWIDLKDTRFSGLASTKAAAIVTPLALYEFAGDKMPNAPHRTMPIAVAVRAASGAASGCALTGGRSPAAALAGAAGSLVATYLGHTVRLRLSRAAGRDLPVALAEDVLTFGGAFLVCLASLAQNQKSSGQSVAQ